MNTSGVVATFMIIAILVGLLCAASATFLTWISGKQVPTALLAGGAAFLTTVGLMTQIFTSVGPLRH